MLRHVLLVIGLVCLAALAAAMYAQDRRMQAAEPAAAAPPPTSSYSPDHYNREFSWTQRVLGRVQEHLKVTQEEWVVLEPKIRPIVEARNELRRARSAWSRRGWDEAGNTPVTSALRNLQSALWNPDATADELARRVEEVRTAKAAVEASLDAAQAELTQAVTPAEAATLVMIGILD